MLATVITIEIIAIVLLAMKCIASWKSYEKDKYRLKWIEQRKKEEKEEVKKEG